MSIVQVRNFMEKSGCALVVSIAIGVGLVIGMLNMNCGGPQQAQGEVSDVVAVVLGRNIGAREIEDLAAAQRSQFGSQLGEVPIMFEAMIVGGAIDQLVQATVTLDLAKKRGIEINDEAIRAHFSRELDKGIQSERERLVSTGKLKADATPEDFVKAVKAENPNFTTFEDIKKQNLDQLNQVLSDPAQKDRLVLSVAPQLLQDAELAKVQLTEEEAKKGYDTLVLKRILLTADKNEGKDLNAEAERILAEIKAGATFESAMDKYSNETPADPQKRVSENELKYGYGMVSTDATLKPVAALKPGETSAPLKEFNGVAIYKLVKVESNLPADWDKEKAKYLDQAKQAKVASVVSEEVKTAQDAVTIEWKSLGYKAIYDYNKVGMASGNPADTKAKYQQVVEDAQKAIDGSDIGLNVARLARYAAYEQLYASASAEEKKDMLANRIEYLMELPELEGQPTLRMQLVDMLIEAERKDEAAELLLDMANTLDFGEGGTRMHGEVLKKLVEMKERKTISEDAAALVDGALDKWVTEKAAYDKEEEDQRKADAEAEKKLAEETKKLEEEAKKATGGDAPKTSGE